MLLSGVPMRGCTREEDVDEGGAGEEPVRESEERPEQPAVAAEGAKHREVDEREYEPGPEVEGVADRLRADPVGSDGGAEEEWEVDPRQPQLAGGAEARREDERADEPAGEGAPHAHAPSFAHATAALIKARWVRAWGKLPRNSLVSGSISSA